MKKVISLLTSLLLTLLSNAQWEQEGQDIFGENLNDFTGSSIAINDIGDRIVLFDAFVNGDTRGRARVFELQNNNWVQLGNEIIGLISGDGQSLGSVMFNSDGDRFIFSSPLHNANGLELSGTVRVFELQNGNWNQLGNDLIGQQAGDYFGASLDMSADGSTIIIGAYQSGLTVFPPGYAKIYGFQSGSWIQLGSQINGTTNGDEAGKSVSMNADGSIIAISSPLNDGNGFDSGRVRVFEIQNGSWIQIGNTIFGQAAEDKLGNTTSANSAISLSSDGSRIAVGSERHKINGEAVGQVRIFELQNNAWVQLGQDIDGSFKDGAFGVTVSLNTPGDVVIIGAPFANSLGEIKIFKLVNGTWLQQGETMVGNEVNDWTGWCVDINSLGDIIIFGSPFTDDNGDNTGKVQIFKNSNVLSISERNLGYDVDLFPNPNNGNFNLKSPESKDKVLIKISDVLGKEVFQKKDFLGQNTEINSELKPGVYFVNIRANEVNQTVKIIIL